MMLARLARSVAPQHVLRSVATTVLPAGVVLAAVVAMPGCKEDPKVSKLFDETGVWALVRYDAEGAGEEKELAAARENAFLLEFKPEVSVVQTAACVFPGTSADPIPLVTPGDTPCGMFDDDTEWQCRCYGYAFENSEMRWVEFTAGDTPPVVTLDPMGMPAGDDAGGSGSGGGGTAGADDGGTGGGSDADGTTIIVNPVSGIGFTYYFRPLPTDVFGSNGVSSRYMMQARGRSVFQTVLDDPMRPSCEPCVP